MNLFALYQQTKKQELEELREIRRACFKLMMGSKKPSQQSTKPDLRSVK